MTTDFCSTCGAYWHCEHRAGLEDPALVHVPRDRAGQQAAAAVHQFAQVAAAMQQFAVEINAVAKQLVDALAPRLQELAQRWAWLLDLLHPTPVPAQPVWQVLPIRLLASAWCAVAPEHPPWQRAPPCAVAL